MFFFVSVACALTVTGCPADSSVTRMSVAWSARAPGSLTWITAGLAGAPPPQAASQPVSRATARAAARLPRLRVDSETTVSR